METKGSPNDFTGSEAIPGLRLGNNLQDGAVLEAKKGNSTGCDCGLKDLPGSGYRQICWVLLVQVGSVACFEVSRGR